MCKDSCEQYKISQKLKFKDLLSIEKDITNGKK